MLWPTRRMIEGIYCSLNSGRSSQRSLRGWSATACDPDHHEHSDGVARGGRQERGPLLPDGVDGSGQSARVWGHVYVGKPEYFCAIGLGSKHVDTLGGDIRWGDGTAVRERGPGSEPGADLCRNFSDSVCSSYLPVVIRRSRTSELSSILGTRVQGFALKCNCCRQR
jgi:hypothetical protein